MIAQGWSRDVTQVHGPGDKASRKRDHQLKKIETRIYQDSNTHPQLQKTQLLCDVK